MNASSYATTYLKKEGFAQCDGGRGARVLRDVHRMTFESRKKGSVSGPLGMEEGVG